MRRFGRSFRLSQESSNNPLDWFAQAFFTLTQNERASHMAATEMCVFYYLFASWRRTPDVPEGSRAFSCHKNSGYVALVGVLVVVVGIETFAIHLLVAQFSEVAATLLSLTSIYAAVWLMGNTRAVVLNPLLVDDEAVTVRWGINISQRIPLSSIDHIDTQEPDVVKRERMNLSTMGAEPCWIVLKEPLLMRTFMGSFRPIQAINVSPDEAAAFKRLVCKS